MLIDLILILVAAAFAILAGAALLGAGAFVVASLGRWRKARKAAHHAAVLNLFAEIAHPGDDLMVVADAVAEPCPELWRDDLGCWHVCAYRGFHDARLHLCRCGALTEVDSDGLLASGGPVGPGVATLREGGTIVNPATTYGQELTYDADGLVQYGTAMVHQRCRDARRDAATDHICELCGRVFGRVAA